MKNIKNPEFKKWSKEEKKQINEKLKSLQDHSPYYGQIFIYSDNNRMISKPNLIVEALGASLTFASLQKLSKIFKTKNINLVGDYELSNGLGIELFNIVL